MKKLHWLLIIILTAIGLPTTAQTDANTAPASPKSTNNGFARAYTEENPLVYEGVWDLWPYAFLNDNGEPEGYNVDLIHLMMKRLGIPTSSS